MHTICKLAKLAEIKVSEHNGLAQPQPQPTHIQYLPTHIATPAHPPATTYWPYIYLALFLEKNDSTLLN